MTYRTGGDLLVQVLRDAGVDTVFGVVSIHNQPLVEAVARDLRFVPVRHEATAVNAADGYGRATGGLGCALTSTGTGAGNAAGSLVESLSSGTSVLHVTGQVDLPYWGSGRGFIHETKDQLGMLNAVSKSAATITSVESAETVLREAVAAALAVPAGPASVEWPIDLQYASHPGSAFPAPETAPSPSYDLDEVVALLEQAERPAVWAGGGVARAGSALQELLERIDAGLITSNSGRGAVPENHPLVVGNYGSTPAGQALLDEADLLLTLGSHQRSNETKTYNLRVPATHIQVDLDPAALGRVFPAKVGVVAEIGAFLDQLVARLAPRPRPAWRTRVEETRVAVRERQRAALGHHAELVDALSDLLPDDAVVARDVTIASSTWGNRLYPFTSPRENVFPRGGGIGQGLGMGIGAALARPDAPTVVVVGDGGLQVHLGELLTAAQENPWLVLLVFNDGGYGVLRNLQDAQGWSRFGVDLTTPDFAALAAASRMPYRRIAAADEVRDTLADALALRAPVLVEVDLAAYGEMPEPFTPPVHVPTSEPEEA